MRITIDLNLDSDVDQEKLFQGLDTWQRLGLLSDKQIRHLCQTYLSVPLPSISTDTDATQIAPGTTTDFVVATPESVSPKPASAHPPRVRSASRSPIPQLLQSFVAEISVIWLLFLGVFLVVVSSGVLAATQWRNFPPVGQYGILFAYTLAFWGVSVLLGRREQLRLTARMLSIATLLIIPVNFWMMDGLRVGQSFLGVLIAAIASVVLTVITIQLLRPTSMLLIGNAIALSVLHWGWGWSVVPLMATYLGTVGTAFCLLRSQSSEASSATPETPPPFPLARIAIAFAVLLLIGRAIFAGQVPPSQLGLAFGICGWLLNRLSRPMPNQLILGRVGAALLVLGWLVSVSEEPPWQAIAVSGLGLGLLWRNLQRFWRRSELTALIFVGFQAFWLLWFVLPFNWRQGILIAASAIADNVTAAELASLGGFVYVVGMIGFAIWLRRQQHPPLATHTEIMALILGSLMVLLSWAVPLVRSLNLLIATLSLVAVIRDRPAGRFGVYFTHAIGLAAVLSWIDTLFPALNEIGGAAILLTLMVGEWIVSVLPIALLWRQSAWYAGLILAALAYPLLWAGDPSTSWNLIGLAVPIMLTVVAVRPLAVQPQIAAWLTVPALVLQLFLLNSLPPQIITFGVGTLLLWVNSRHLRSLVLAILTVGFGLGFISTWIYQEFSTQLTAQWVMVIMAGLLTGLWLLRGWLKRRSTPMHTLYAIATDTWAIGLCSVLLLILTSYAASFYTEFETVTGLFVWAAGLTTLALGYRLWQQSTQFVLWGLAWAVELWVAGVLLLVNPSATVTSLAIATLALGFVTQLAGDGWVIFRRDSYQTSWHAIPLTYGVLGLILSHSTYSEFTGLYTLAAALIWVGVGRRQPFLQPITYVALAGVSIALYELLVYQLLQAEGGNAGDGITLLAGLALLIAVGDRLLSRWLLPYLHLDRKGLSTIADVHWLLGSGLALLAVFSSLSETGFFLWLSVSITLSAYALANGNRYFRTDTIDRVSSQSLHASTDAINRVPSPSTINRVPSPSTINRAPSHSPSPEAWTYAGIIEATLVIAYALHRLLPDPQILLTWGGAIAAALCLLLHPLPWERWGWSPDPWKQSTGAIPAITTVLTFWGIALQTLLIVGAFYAWLAKANGQLRLSYVSVLLLDWAVLRYLNEQGWSEPIWISTVVGCSVLYVVQIDPELQAQDDRENRHLLRLLATGLICLTALYQAEIEPQPTAIVFALLTLGLSVGLILLGIVLRVRAFLYVGTATFVIRVLRLLWLFVSNYSALLWAVGIVLGLIFIWIAATFEARRTQVNTLMQTWTAELSAWE
ncbi:hypothetical protein H6G89_07105 [Oscillatoria sp. FACHB-1407]|uniref:hypothetical protein n=1 Tax=Oscillatoria sp. FACHB-1407 TaxID=2692847 RepID=UPI00168411BE|nr:hypothetical protein [Oscillatoria sp. FACHB-1407]MBD2460809.1 hypothetical protein [Oscillatoria sp. FACHB-1407]